MRRILFLDIDGTLSGYEFLKTGKGFIDPACVVLLNELEGVEVVISSSWGYDNGRTEKSLRGCGLTLPIIGYTEHFYQDWICRGNEIEKWLQDTFHGMGTKFGPCYADSHYEYVIVDDDCDMLLGQSENFVRTDRETGIIKEDIEKIKTILKIKKDE